MSLRSACDEILDALSPLYSALLALSATGRTDAEIADTLDVAPESVPTMIRLARRKLDRLLAERTPQR